MDDWKVAQTVVVMVALRVYWKVDMMVGGMVELMAVMTVVAKDTKMAAL